MEMKKQKLFKIYQIIKYQIIILEIKGIFKLLIDQIQFILKIYLQRYRSLIKEKFKILISVKFNKFL